MKFSPFLPFCACGKDLFQANGDNEVKSDFVISPISHGTLKKNHIKGGASDNHSIS
jgi:hypothetical protein